MKKNQLVYSEDDIFKKAKINFGFFVFLFCSLTPSMTGKKTVCLCSADVAPGAMIQLE
jgi:hypothetical protein